ncbi:RelA/SpoT domain-containing protein [Massilia suwonensis]|uniref:RelA/SpoT domain-containing protein n=1 Tax=Massilia suwonensis TaxID=648895 RepID=A0ABW0MLX2_9BURK
MGSASEEDYWVIDEWRAAHRAVLNTFQAILHKRARGRDIIVAQRHKRKRTVFDKLARQQRMNLSRMDDVAGCRLIFRTIEELHEFRESFHNARFRHKRRNDVDKYNYIASPKPTGYRGIHDVYEYDVNSAVGKRLTGLYVEIQYRTRVQHSWSTANEVIGHVTENEPKFGRGDKKIEHAMALSSEILARAHEGMFGPFPELDNRDLVEQFLTLDKEIGLLRMLRGLNTSDLFETKNKNTILIFKDGEPVEAQAYRDAPDALRALFQLENNHPEWDIVLVRAETGDEVRLAFKNYFSDARDFIKLVDIGCTKLTKTKKISDVWKPRLLKKPPPSKGPASRRKWWEGR